MASPTRGLIKIAAGAGALYFVVMRNLGSAVDWYNERQFERQQQRALLRSLAQEKKAMLTQQGSS